MQKICNFLNPILKRKMGSARYNEILIKYNWSDIIGVELAKKCVPVRVEKNILVILSESSTLNHHLLTIQAKLVEQINSFLATPYIKGLFFINGSIKDFEWNLSKNDIEQQDLRRVLKQMKLDAQGFHDIKQLTKNVCDENLREKINQVLVTNKKYRQLLLNQGYKKCSNCELLVDKSVDKCIFCAQLEKNEIKNNLKVILWEAPYIDFYSCQNYIKCDRILFDNVKNEIISELLRKRKANNYTKKDLLVYAMLLKGEEAMEFTFHDKMTFQEVEKLCAYTNLPKHKS